MAFAIAVLLGCQLAGELLRRAFGLPLPGPLIGMFLLAAILVARGYGRAPAPAPDAETRPLVRVANGLIGVMGLLFVPAGVGLITEFDILRQAWLPILAGLAASTVLGLIVTGLVMHHVSRAMDRDPAS